MGPRIVAPALDLVAKDTALEIPSLLPMDATIVAVLQVASLAALKRLALIPVILTPRQHVKAFAKVTMATHTVPGTPSSPLMVATRASAMKLEVPRAVEWPALLMELLRKK